MQANAKLKWEKKKQLKTLITKSKNINKNENIHA